MELAVSGCCPCEAKLSSKEGVVTEDDGDEIRGSGELGILGVQFKRGINAMFLNFSRSGNSRRAFLTTFGGGTTNHGLGSCGFLGSVDGSE
jgi:hypothetical protein